MTHSFNLAIPSNNSSIVTCCRWVITLEATWFQLSGDLAEFPTSLVVIETLPSLIYCMIVDL